MAEFEVQVKDENLVFRKSPVLTDTVMHYCPGCSHGTVHNIVAQVVEELGIQEKTIAVSPVGCSVFAYNYLKVDWCQAAHGRACAVATGIKRISPDKMVFTYQGDGDLSAIGTAETIHACNRGENITVIFINNAIYGMTGGQMSPTTLLGMKTATTPYGRDAKLNGFPYKIADMISALEGVCYVTRQAVDTPAAVRKTKNAIKKAFQNSLNEKGLSFIEVVATCNSGWKLSPVASNEWMKENLIPAYPLGDIKG